MGAGASSCTQLDQFSNGCEIHKCAIGIKGLESNSSSPSDTWILKLENSKYEDKVINNVFVKYFIEPDTLVEPDRKTQMLKNVTHGLKYELYIYKDIIRPLIDTRICPNFIKYLGSGEMCEFSSLQKILSDAVIRTPEATFPRWNEPVKMANDLLERNLLYMANGLKNRPSIIDPTLGKTEVLNRNQKMHYNTQFYKHRNFYPTNGGLLSFVNNAKKYLISNEVDIINSYNIDKVKMHGSKFGIINKDIELNANNIFWTSEIKYLEDVFGTENKISDYILNVPMIIFYFFLKAENITDYTYITDYDEDTYIYRTSSSGLYGNQIINGNSFICVEVPTDLNSTIWADTEKFTRKIWQEVLHLGQAKGIMPKKIKIIKTPFSYKPLKYGYLEKFKKLDEELCDKYAGLKFTNPSLYSKVSIAKEIENIL